MTIMREEIFTIKGGRVISRTEGWNFNFIVAIIHEETGRDVPYIVRNIDLPCAMYWRLVLMAARRSMDEAKCIFYFGHFRS